MSSMNRCVSDDLISGTGTGSAGLRSTGCPSRATFRMAISRLSLRARIVAYGRLRLPAPLGTVPVWGIALQIAQERVHVRCGIPEVEILGLDEASVDAALNLRPQRVEVAVEIENGDGLGVIAELLEGERLE